MKHISLCVLMLFALYFPGTVHAIEDPLAKPNNKIGIHILFDHELPQAAKMINANGGDWGYVVIPIQADDRNLIKWQAFMNSAHDNHVIPILRLATEGDYFNTKVWRKPNYLDIVDFANFLDSLNWPTKNRYVIVFNEVNRADEWGGTVNPKEYAEILSFAVTVFKTKSQDFFVIGAGMDNAAPQEYPNYMNQYTYFREMNAAVPGVFNQIDGHSSHSYPNPGFSQPPSVNTTKSIYSFTYERELLKSMSNKTLPVFITETGWNAPYISEAAKAEYFQTAFTDVWSDPGIVTVAPFLFHAGDGPFKGFSFIAPGGGYTEQGELFAQMPKTKGNPTVSLQVLGIGSGTLTNYSFKDFSNSNNDKDSISIMETAKSAFKWIMKL